MIRSVHIVLFLFGLSLMGCATRPSDSSTWLVVMRPLLLHASSAAEQPGHRRVIHLEFAAEPLSDGLEWLSENKGVS